MADEEVGPSIARGNQLVNGNCADLIIAGSISIHTINTAIPAFPACNEMDLASPN
jgi:hypothetical protein